MRNSTILKHIALTSTAIVALAAPAHADRYAPMPVQMMPTQAHVQQQASYPGHYQPIQMVNLQRAPHLQPVYLPRVYPHPIYQRQRVMLPSPRPEIRPEIRPNMQPGLTMPAYRAAAFHPPMQNTMQRPIQRQMPFARPARFAPHAVDLTQRQAPRFAPRKVFGQQPTRLEPVYAPAPNPAPARRMQPVQLTPDAAPAPVFIPRPANTAPAPQLRGTSAQIQPAPRAHSPEIAPIRRAAPLAKPDHIHSPVQTPTRIITQAPIAPQPAIPFAHALDLQPALRMAPAAPLFMPADTYCQECDQPHDGAVFHERDTDIDSAPESAEGDVLRYADSYSGFKISVDGETVAGDGFDYASGQRAQDVAMAATDIQVKYDGLDVVPMLNIGLVDDAVGAVRGQPVTFLSYSNYNAFIERGEVRVFHIDDSAQDRPVAVAPIVNGAADLDTRALPDDLFYVLRVYGHKGQFDETSPKPLTLTDTPLADVGSSLDGNPTLSIYGNDRTAMRNIKVAGGAVTVFGENVPPAHIPVVLGRHVPIDDTGKFVTQEILPYGDHPVTVSVTNPVGQGVNFTRDIHIADREFFYVAIGDLTLGQRQAVGPADLTAAQDSDFDEVVVNGRGAFYLKGKVRGDYLITAALDTGEERIEDLFSNLDKKDPRQLLRRLDSDRYYPVYGDDSYIREDAPTQGKFYVRLDRGDDHVMWGNFATQVTGTEFAHLDRGLYGAIADFNSDAATSFGERKTEITAFAADPGTIPGRDEFRGTGGSLYFLDRQDLTVGSERLRIEIRDKVTGTVLETRNLRPQEDYDIDYLQGRIVLSDPLQSTFADDQIVRDGGLSGNDAFLVARYEFTPGLTEVDGYTVGGRASQWLGDHLRVGVTAQTEATAQADQELLGTDLFLRKSDNTFLKAEYARTEGPGFGQSNSTDGGFIFEDIVTPGAAGQIAEAYRLEGAVDLEEIFGGLEARISGLIEHADAGFSGVGRLGDGEVDRYSAGVDWDVSERTSVSVEYDDLQSSTRGDNRSIYADINQKIGEHWDVGLGVRHDERDNIITGAPINPLRRDVNGSRTDASVQLRYDSGNDWDVYAFGQGTIAKDGTRRANSRGGIGGQVQLNQRMTVSGEVSGGDGGVGASAQVAYARSEDTEYYLGYALSTGRSDTGFATESQAQAGLGTLTVGGRSRLSDSLSVYGEEQMSLGGKVQQFTHSYGVDFTPNDKWTFGASAEVGTIEDDVNGAFDRKAVTLSAARASEGLRIASALEGRFEDGVANGRARDRKTYLMRNSIAYDAGQDWELIGRANFAISESDQASLQDADFVEGVAAAAYRPVENDRFNALLKYTYFEDLAPAQQRSNLNRTDQSRQRSQILSVDGQYDLTPRLSIGAKYGFRKGEVALDRASDIFVSSDAHLGVVRADYHVVSQWDIMAEARVKKSELAQDMQTGGLVGVYRHVGDNLKVGVGYSFSEFSDDLTDFSDDSQGAFLNLVGKF